MLSPDLALQSILQRVAPLEAERVPLLEAGGRILAEPIRAQAALPAWDNSAMDGYAVRHGELREGGAMPVAFECAAGAAGDRSLPPGQAARIFTGAPLPPGADTVVMQEDTERRADGVVFRVIPAPGAHVRRVGSDVALNQPLLAPGRVLSPGDLGLLAALGRSQLAVIRRPVVALLATGDELRPVDAPALARGQIRDSNAWMLAAAVKALGGVPRILPAVGDDRAAVDQALWQATRADAALSIGGVSVGDHDHLGHALRALAGPDFAFWKVAIKPGKPLAFATVGHCIVFGLPGNPVSAQVTFERFAGPALLKLAGHTRLVRRRVLARLDAPLPAGGARETWHRASLREAEGELWVDPARSQSSGAQSSLAGADALVCTPPHGPARAVGDQVEIMRLDVEDRVPA